MSRHGKHKHKLRALSGVSDELWEACQKAADRAGVSRSEWLRKLMTRATWWESGDEPTGSTSSAEPD